MEIIEYSSNLANEIADLYYESVHAIDSSIYSDEQKLAWAPMPINYHKWATRLADKKPYVMVIEGEVAGFIELEADGHIDCAYVSPRFQRTGVATNLLNHLMSEAKIFGLNQLYVEASIVAKPFFEKHGFVVVNKNKIIRHNIVLVNYSMHMAI